MQDRNKVFAATQRGFSLSGLIFVLAVLGVLAVFAMKVVPTYAEYRSIQGAIQKAKSDGGSAAEMQRSFDKNAEINNITAINGHDLVITKDNGEPEISFAYDKKIPLASNVSLVINYAGTTDKSGAVAAKTAASADQ
jgi:type II secretory pathway pseudopilin PulG